LAEDVVVLDYALMKVELAVLAEAEEVVLARAIQ